ncbi:MAG TPA: class I SAM-dependent methyltransferase [Candidatus Sulfotelmatobacter sp.]|nr:class I SAM-dependent methyltransferase [Candidatus Sulfotelmatobacter sp.]
MTLTTNTGCNCAGEVPLGAAGALHDRLVINRRIDVLSSLFARMAPAGSRILDVGCGDGLLAATLLSKRPDLHIQGLEVLPRENTHIPVGVFDGSRLPFDDDSFDAVLFSDVLHHTSDPVALLREARRVARFWLLLKDHYCKGLAAAQRLRFMDWVGNARFGVALPYNYWTEQQWRGAWQQLGLEPEEIVTRLRLYAVPVDWVFGAQLHFMVRLRKLA